MFLSLEDAARKVNRSGVGGVDLFSARALLKYGRCTDESLGIYVVLGADEIDESKGAWPLAAGDYYVEIPVERLKDFDKFEKVKIDEFCVNGSQVHLKEPRFIGVETCWVDGAELADFISRTRRVKAEDDHRRWELGNALAAFGADVKPKATKKGRQPAKNGNISAAGKLIRAAFELHKKQTGERAWAGDVAKIIHGWKSGNREDWPDVLTSALEQVSESSLSGFKWHAKGKNSDKAKPCNERAIKQQILRHFPLS